MENKEFNLSKKIFGVDDPRNRPEGFIDALDVKEFIKRLKEGKKKGHIACSFKKIDKLAGDELK